MVDREAPLWDGCGGEPSPRQEVPWWEHEGAHGYPVERPCYDRGMALELFAGILVTDYTAALAWYEGLFGSRPAFFPTDTEAVWELAEHRCVYIVQRSEHAGHAMHTILIDDLDTHVTEVASRGLEPTNRETYANGVRKITYHDPDGNEFGFGGVAL